MKIERILVPVDFSACSKIALEHAVVYSASFGASIDLVHVFGVQDHLPPEATAAILGEARDKLEQLARAHAQQQLDAVATDVRARAKVGECIIEQGDPAATIASIAEKRKTSMIVMGTHGRTGLAHLLMGSVAENVLRRAQCPVLTVRSPSAD